MAFEDAVATIERSRALMREARETLDRSRRLRNLLMLWRDTSDACRHLYLLCCEEPAEETQQAMVEALLLRETIIEVMHEELDGNPRRIARGRVRRISTPPRRESSSAVARPIPPARR